MTAESQHFNSAVNNLLQGRLKHRGRQEGSSEAATTTRLPNNNNDFSSVGSPDKSPFEDLLKEVFASDSKSNADGEVTTPMSQPEQSEALQNQVDPVTQVSREDSTKPEVASPSLPEVVSEQSKIVTNDTDVVSAVTNEAEFLGTSESPSTILPEVEKVTNLTEESLSSANDPNFNELPTNPPLMTTMTIPRKSWDSTIPYKNSAASNKEENLSYSKKNIENEVSEESTQGHGNQIIENDYREENIKTEDNLLSETNREENYPKNHRSEWSEVRYPTSSELYNYNNRLNATPSQLPGIVAESEGDTSVKTLSDYVKAIFDTMKTTDEQKSENETFSSVDSSSPDVESASSTENYSSGMGENSANVPTEIPSSSDYSTENVEILEYSQEKLTSNLSETKHEENIKEDERVAGNTKTLTENEKEEFTKQPQTTEIVETTKYVEETTEVSTETNSIDSSSSSTSSQSSKISPRVDSASPIDSTTTTTTETLPPVKNLSQTKLGAVLRTSTTTKVSHMTEICYRGRCVMTKPKKELYAR